MHLSEISEVIGAEMTGPEAIFSSVSTDSRCFEESSLFIALKGENFNGEDFVEDAAKNGAVGVVVSVEKAVNLTQLRVDDTAKALGEIGAFNRRLSSACVLAITGSQGKTTVKEMLASILSCSNKVAMTQGNLNNTLGVPMTLLNINAEHKYAVVELGANEPGEIECSVSYTQPDIAHITNIAPTHIEGFGSLEGVAEAKGELWQGLKPGGLAVISLDDPFAERWLSINKSRPSVCISALGNPEAEYSIASYTLNPQGQTECKIRTPQGDVAFSLSLLGHHNLANGLAAVAMSCEAGASHKDVIDGLEKMQPVPGRMQPIKGLSGSLIIDDSYNASPTSFEAAIDVLSSMHGRKILVAGDMAELGVNEIDEHREVGAYASEKNIDLVLTAGNLSRYLGEEFKGSSRHFSSQEGLMVALEPELQQQVCVLVKGSRSAGLDKLVKKLTKIKV